MAIEEVKQEEVKKENALPIKYNKNYSVIQANELVRSKQDELSLLEIKLIRLAVAQVLKEDTDLKTYSCNVARLAEFLGISRQNIYTEVQDLSVNIMKKSIFIKDKDGKPGKKNYKIFHWVDYVEYKDGVITFKLSEQLKPYLVGLNELFLKYGFSEILKLPTTNAIRLYELLYSYANIQFHQEETENRTFEGVKLGNNEVVFTIEYLREYFNCKEKYPNTGDFVKRIIKAGIDDINEYTVFPCSFLTVKEKNRITKIIFKFDDWETDAGESIIKRIAAESREEYNGR